MTSNSIDARVQALESTYKLLDRIDELEKATVRRRWFGVVTTPTVIAAILALAASCSTAIVGYSSARSATDVSRAKASAEIRIRYLDKALAADAKLTERELLLRYLSQVPDDERLRGWARSELQAVESELKAARERIGGLEKTNSKLVAQLAEAQNDIVELSAKAAGTPELQRQHADLVKHSKALEQQIANLTREKHRIERSLSSSPDPRRLLERARDLNTQIDDVRGHFDRLVDRIDYLTANRGDVSGSRLLQTVRENAEVILAGSRAAAQLSLSMAGYLAELDANTYDPTKGITGRPRRPATSPEKQ